MTQTPPPTQAEIDNEKTFKELLEKAEYSSLTEREKLELEVVKELNKKHAVVHTSQMYVLTEKYCSIKRETTFCLETKKSFLDTYENKTMQLPKASGKGFEVISKGKIWIKHEKRKEFLNGITFDPTKEGHSHTQYNIWKGFSVQRKSGVCKKFLDHIRFIICAGNEEKYSYVINWLASLVQHPDRLGAALVLIGLQGVGKNCFVEVIGTLFGQHFIQLSSLKELLGNFNMHLQNAVLIHANEALWGGDRREIGKIKSSITESLVLIEGKNKDTIAVKNYRHLIFSTNEAWPVHIDPDDRRFMVLHVSDEMKEDKAYFGSIHDEMNNGGYEALLDYLLSIDLTGINISSIPQSDDSLEIKLESAGDVARYVHEALRAGCFNIGIENVTADWLSVISKEAIRQDYAAWCLKEGVKPKTTQLLGRDIVKYTGASPCKPRSGRDRCPSYEYRSLTAARQHFEKAFKVTSAIWEL